MRTKRTARQEEVAGMEADRFEIENRIRNLMWTISGDYDLDTKLDVASFHKSKYISIYDAIKQGAFSRFFDKDAFTLYLVKKVYLGADEMQLVQLGQLCVEMGCHGKIAQERPGVPDIRRKAFDAILDHDFDRLMHTYAGKIKAAVLREALTGSEPADGRILEPFRMLKKLETAESTDELIATADALYNKVIDPTFEKRVGGLERVLAVTMSELSGHDWKDFLEEEAAEDAWRRYQRQLADAMADLSEKEQTSKEEEEERKGTGVICLDEEAVSKMNSYIELNYGRSYLSPLEQERLNRKICTGAHADCTLYFTDGILANRVRVNAQSEYARRTLEINRRVYQQNRRVTRQNIEILTDLLKRALVARKEREYVIGEFGQILPNRLWNVGRTENRRLFVRENKNYNSDFVVEVLIDGSGSQRARQSQVALQAFIISEALSNVEIPHRMMSFCTFWDYTVMRRFREYEEGREANSRIFEFYGSSNNRDGLAVRAAAYGLLQRPEENKILIVLSDGRPNDIVVNRPNSRNPRPYFGDYGVKDTAFEVRRLRNAGVAVLGVFAGEEQDLQAERKIFGKDFAYIRDIRNFSNVVGRYLRKQLEE